MAGEKLGLGTEVRRLRLGDSFTKNSQTAFHTIRYDFKPASVDTKKMANVEIGQNNQATVTVPHIEGSGTSHTVFKGPRRSYTKECVLIIDNSTGEIVLERLSSSITLKKTRAEGSSRMQPPTTLIEPPQMQQQLQVSQQQMPSTNNKKLSPTQKYSPVQRLPPSPGRKLSPKHLSPNRHSPTNLVQRSPANQRSPSMPSLIPPAVNSSSSNSLNNSKAPTVAFVKEGSMPMFALEEINNVESMDTAAAEVGILSDSSNDSSSGSSSSSDSSDSENEDAAAHMPVIAPPTSLQRPNNGKVMNGNSHDKSSSKPLASMPQFNQLSEDLHLSESESD